MRLEEIGAKFLRFKGQRLNLINQDQRPNLIDQGKRSELGRRTIIRLIINCLKKEEVKEIGM